MSPHEPPATASKQDFESLWLRTFCIRSGALGLALEAFMVAISVVQGRIDLAVLEGLFLASLLASVTGAILVAGAPRRWLALGVASVFVYPSLIAWFSGGMEGSAGRSFWSFVAPLTVLIVWSCRRAVVVLGAFLVLQIALFDIPSPYQPVVGEFRTILGHFNLLGMLVYSFTAFAVFRIQGERQSRIMREHEIEHKAVELKSEILNVMSHEIRTPLNAIIGLLDLMSSERMSPRQEEHLRTVQFASENLLLLVNDVLDYSKLQNDAMHFESIPFDAGLVLRSTLLAQERQARIGDVALTGDWDQESPRWIQGDPVRLAQVVTNLVSNAIKFSRGGSVDVRGSWSGGCLFLSVKDSGIGIAPERQATIFEPFVQAESSTTRKYGGTGLGLAIVKRIVESAGGSIRLDSAPGKGSLFEVCMPWSEAAPATRPEALHPLRRWKILLVDDNALNTRVAERLLEHLGQEVASVAGGEEAIAWLEDNSCDLVLMDIQMPGLDGIATTRIIRKRWGTATPIVALSAESMRHVQETAIQAGMQGLLPKPVNSARLRACLAERQALVPA